MEKITRDRAKRHVERCEHVRDNCKHVSRISDWKVISNGLDAGAYRSDRKTLYIAIDGSSTFREWLDNLRVSSRDGAHRGFAMAATNFYAQLLKDIPHNFAWYREIVLDGHSRGGAIVQYLAMLIRAATVANIKIEVVTSGSPVLWREDKLKYIESTKPYTHHCMRTKLDFVDNVNAPRGLITRFLFRRIRLHHYISQLYKLPTVRGKIDHLAYKEAIENSPDSIWG